MKIPDIITAKDNFWNLNHQYTYIFNDFYNKDKSKNKEKSSIIMWAIYFKIHPNSDFFNLANKEDIIKEKWLKDSNFDWSKYEKELELFKDAILSQAEKSLIAWNDTMKRRDEFIHDQEFSLDHYNDEGKIVKGTADQLDKMLANTSKLYAEYFKIQKELSDEEVKRGKGNKPKSLSDAGDI